MARSSGYAIVIAAIDALRMKPRTLLTDRLYFGLDATRLRTLRLGHPDREDAVIE